MLWTILPPHFTSLHFILIHLMLIPDDPSIHFVHLPTLSAIHISRPAHAHVHAPRSNSRSPRLDSDLPSSIICLCHLSYISYISTQSHRFSVLGSLPHSFAARSYLSAWWIPFSFLVLASVFCDFVLLSSAN
ncbi:hypothetical protein DENSPDRAFT_50804 [Dentipellis sp. KUC8613]|nr:hypothetical protein DENSPDRAFT_50804 [Dentipellis sp. KUC8613]